MRPGVDVYSMGTCCGILELGCFEETIITKESILRVIKEYHYDDYEIDYNKNGLLHNYIAVTNSKDQPNTEKILKELGFKARKITGRYKTNLIFWSLFKHPKEIADYIKNLKRDDE